MEGVGERREVSLPRREPARSGCRWRHSSAVVRTVLRWVVLVEFIYVFSFPVLYIVTTATKTLSDLNNPSVYWIPPSPTLEGLWVAARMMDYLGGLRISVWTAMLAALGQTLIGSMVAYGFARVRFPGREVLFAFLLFTIVIPPQTIMVPLFMLYSKLGWANAHAPLFVPGFLGWGVRGGILLIVYRQFFRGLPYELEDAARVDGAGPLRTLYEIMLPLAKPAVVVVFVFSLTWTWNDGFVPWLVISRRNLMTIQQRLEIFYIYQTYYGDPIPENIGMSGVVLAVLPVLIVYVIAQRHFTQSIDRTGLVE